jgi:hypothetical protein
MDNNDAYLALTASHWITASDYAEVVRSYAVLVLAICVGVAVIILMCRWKFE